MSTVATPVDVDARALRPSPRVPMSFAGLVHAYAVEARLEFLRMLRAPMFVVPFLLLPAPLYLLFGVVMPGAAIHANRQIGNALFVGFSVFAVVGPALFGVGCSIAVERDQGLLRLKRAMPAPAGSYLVAKVLVELAYAALAVATVAAMALIGRTITLNPAQLFGVCTLLVLGTIPFCSLGLFIGTRVSGSAAPGLMNLAYLPMIYLSGLFFPLPQALAHAAVIWPTFHLNRLALALGGVRAFALGDLLVSTAVLTLLVPVLGGLAVRRLARVG